MSAFKTLERGAIDTPVGPLQFATAYSRALGRRADLCVWLPVEPPVAMLTLLHGVYASHWAWALCGGAHETAAALVAAGEIPPLMLAMPSDGLHHHGSGYVAHADADYESWIVDEVPALAVLVAGCTPGLQAIAGLSMGGYGALRLALRHADRYEAAVGMSSITRWQDMRLFVGSLERYPEPEDPDIGPLAAAALQRPALRIDCGRGDLLVEQNRALHAELVDAGVEHTYDEYPGGHEWAYWREHLADALRFVARSLRDPALEERTLGERTLGEGNG